jgi:ADP-heptose:LPS heptosyltransferase
MNPQTKSLLVVHHEGVGDLILSLPLLRLISDNFKDYDLYLWIGTDRRDLFLSFDRFEMVEECDEEALDRVLELYHEIVFDLGTGLSHITDTSPGASLKYGTYVGFSRPTTVPREITIPRSLSVPMWKQFISLLSLLGITSDSVPSVGIVTDTSSKAHAETLLDFDTRLPLICVAPGGDSDIKKRWRPEYFAKVIQELHMYKPAQFALIGSISETAIGQRIAGLLEFQVDNLIGMTTLGTVAYILRHSALLLANDNGIMHLGGLMDVPTIGLFGPSNSDMYSPMGARSIVVKAASGNVRDIHPESVTQVCLDLLAANKHQAVL